MQTNDPASRLTIEDLSDCRSDSSHSESQIRAFQDYDRIKELNLTIDKSKDDRSDPEPKDFHLGIERNRAPLRFDEFINENPTRNLPMSMNKKDFVYPSNGLNEINYSHDRTEVDDSMENSPLCGRSKNPIAKDLLFNLRDSRQKNSHPPLSTLDRCGKDLNFTVERDIKEFGLLKNYSLDRMKEFNLSLDRMRDNQIGNLALERLRGNTGLLENPILDHGEFRNLQVQPRNTDLEAIALEHMRRSHLLGSDLSPQNLSTQIPHPHSITQMQHSQQQQQQQAKSFTIDAILGLRNNQREKRNQQQQYRKHQAQEGTRKSGGSGSCSGSGGKLKRVRTIFTAEQLERLEGEFARQQYMVGPERLYLAHALRLTEAQVKVWFQNRRIKWRKHHHEQQSQRVHEFQRSLSTSLEHEDSNETDKCETRRTGSCKKSERRASKFSSPELDTISERTESTTTMEQSEKNKIKYMPQHSPVWSSKYQPERDMSQAYWKYQRNNLTLPAVKNNRGMPSPTADSNYYLTTCKQHKHHSCPNSGYQKYSTVQNEPSRRCASPPIQSRHARTKLCADNVATVRKSRYKDEVEDEDNPKYVEDEQGNFTEDNIDDYVCDEAEDDQEETVDSADKDYDEQEADNEVYEESYTCPQLQRLQKRTNKPMSKLPQKSRAAEQQQLDMRRLRYQQPSRLQNIYQENLSTRYYHNDLETPDAVSEEEVIRPIPPKGSSKRSPMNYLQTWTQPRNSTNRYESSNSPTQPTRRARTRPEIESLLEPEPDSSKKCSRCGNSSNKKEPTTRKNVCRFQNHSNLPVKGAIGDEMNTDEQMYNRYNRHGPEGSSATCGIPRSAYYAMKPRRSKGSRLPLYEAPEDQDQRQLIDEITNDYISSTSRCPKEMPHVFRERTGHPMQMARGQNSTRFPSRYAD